MIVPEAVLAYVADHLRASVRELEGALHSLIAHATMTGKRLDLALAKTALRDTIRHTARAVALKDVEKAVCQLFQIEPDALKADNRARAVAYPRMLAMYLARKHTGAAYSEIGRFFGGRNHSTVISAEKKVARLAQGRGPQRPARRLRDDGRHPQRPRTDPRGLTAIKIARAKVIASAGNAKTSHRKRPTIAQIDPNPPHAKTNPVW